MGAINGILMGVYAVVYSQCMDIDVSLFIS